MPEAAPHGNLATVAYAANTCGAATYDSFLELEGGRSGYELTYVHTSVGVEYTPACASHRRNTASEAGPSRLARLHARPHA